MRSFFKPASILLLQIFVSFFVLHSQGVRKTKSGKIVTADGIPISNATIRVGDYRDAAVSDSMGNFSILVSAGTKHLLISCVGYKNETVNISDGSAAMLIKLTSNETNLKEVIVSTGYQNLPAERVAGSFEQINNALLNRKTGPDILSRLDGVSTSLYIDKTPGSPTPLAIRGLSTLTSTSASPLIIIDNFPYDGDIANINPNNVESITILKDASAASIWGARAGNGVIVITTRKGNYNQAAKITLNSNVTFQAKPNLFYLPEMSSNDFIDVETFLFGKGFYDADIANTSRPVLSPVVEILLKQKNGSLSPTEALGQINAFRNVDVRDDFKKYLYRPAVAQQYSLSMAGGNAIANYNLSAGYDKSLQNLVGNSNDRMVFRFVNSIRPVKNMEFQSGITYTLSNQDTNSPGAYGNIFTDGGKSHLYPYAKLMGENGNALAIEKKYRYNYIDTAGGGKLLDWKYRPLDELKFANNHSRGQDLLLNFGLKYNVSKSLSAEVKYQMEKAVSDQSNYNNLQTFYTRDLINRYTQINGNSVTRILPPVGILYQGNGSLDGYALRGQLNYQTSLRDKHTITALAGAELRESRSRQQQGVTYGYDNNTLTYSNVDYINYYPIYGDLSFASPIANTASFDDKINRFTSVYANISYSYLNRYILTGSGRKDASNLFGVSTNQKGVPLWSVGAAWNIANEKFYKSDLLPFLKLRVTYGYSGNVDNSRSSLTTLTYRLPSGLTNLPTAIISSPPNEKLRWEKTAMWNIGIDFATKNQRLSGTVEWYTKKSADLISPVPVDLTTGFSSLNLNSAVLASKGLDFTLNTKIITGLFNWNNTLLLAYNRNQVREYYFTPSNAKSFVGPGYLITPVTGKSAYNVISYSWAGLDNTAGNPQGYVNKQVSTDYTAITNTTPLSDLVYHGSSKPTVYGSFRNDFSYKNITISVNIFYRLGYFFRRPTIQYNDLFNYWIGNKDYANRWKQPGDEKNTSVPSLVYPSNAPRDFFYANSAATVEKGDHIRLQDINLSYNFPLQHKKSFFQQIQVYLYANNLGILWRANKYNIDPEAVNGLPSAKSISVGLKTTF